MICSATDCPFTVSYTRKRCLSTDRDRNANKFPLGEKDESAVRCEASWTTGWDKAEVAAGRPLGGFVRDFFDLSFEGILVGLLRQSTKYEVSGESLTEKSVD